MDPVKLFVFSFIALFLMFLNNLFSNDGLVTAWNGNVKSGKSSQIQMVKEVVYIKMFEDSCYVRCKFWFYNHGKDDTVKVGFPSEIYDEDSPGCIPLLDFLSIVNHHDLDIEMFKESFTLDTTLKDDGSIEIIDTTGYIEWFVKDVSFRGFDTTIIEDSYHSKWTSSSGDYSLDKTFRYIIGTGATWFGNIKEGTIIFDHSNYMTNALQRPLEYNNKNVHTLLDDNYTVFKFHDLKPEIDQAFEMRFIDFKNVWFPDNSDDNKESKDSYFIELITLDEITQNKLVLMKNEILAHNGYIFSDSIIQKYYDGMKWYLKDKKFKENKMDNIFYKSCKNSCIILPIKEKLIYNDLFNNVEINSSFNKEIKYLDTIFEIDKQSK